MSGTNIDMPGSEAPNTAIVHADDDTDWETEARAEGWVPEGEWEGAAPKHGFLDAKSFVQRGRDVLPIVKAKNRRLEGEMASLKTQLTELQGTATRFNQFAQDAIDRERREKAGLIEQLEGRRAQAITDGDGQAAVSVERRIAELRGQETSQPPPAPAVPHYTEEELRPVRAFIAANEWYNTDPDLRDWADARSVRLRNEGHQPGPALLDKVAQQVRVAFPHKFNRSGGTSSSVESGGRRQPEQFGKRTFDDLPEEAKRAYDSFRRTNPRLTKTEYLNLYEWD